MDNTQIAVQVFDKLAELYQQKFMDVSLYRESLDEFCVLVPHNASVLELACGPGNITKYLLDKRSDLNLTATDLAPNMIRLAKINNPVAEFLVMDCRNLLTLNKKFHAVMCGFCLPYLSKEDAVQLISDCANALLPGGILYISTMEDDYGKSGLKKGSTGDEIFMYYHELPYLQEAMLNAGFKIKKYYRQNFPTSDTAPVTDLIVIAQL